MYSVWVHAAFPAWGFPIRISPDQRLLATSPKLIAGCYVLHRHVLSSHPPYALNDALQPLPYSTFSKWSDRLILYSRSTFRSRDLSLPFIQLLKFYSGVRDLFPSNQSSVSSTLLWTQGQKKPPRRSYRNQSCTIRSLYHRDALVTFIIRYDSVSSCRFYPSLSSGILGTSEHRALIQMHRQFSRSIERCQGVYICKKSR